METLRGKDLKLFEEIVSLTQEELLRVMKKYLKKHYKKITATADYILAEGDIPIALVAHLDTVFSRPAVNVFYDTKKNVMWSPEGLGADDRSGVWMIIQLIQSGLRPHVILTVDEEKGCLGSTMLVHDYEKCPFKDCRYIIQLDRRGQCDCVFYDCDNPDFTKYIEGFGFITAIGSFSDISVICPDWGIAGVNLSVGYVGEHSVAEVQYVQPMLSTLNKVKNMLRADNIPEFIYIYGYDYYGYGRGWNSWFTKKEKEHTGSFDFTVRCKQCGKLHMEIDTFAVKQLGGGTVFYCSECIGQTDTVDWCLYCGEPFELDGKASKEVYCEDCRKETNKCIAK